MAGTGGENAYIVGRLGNVGKGGNRHLDWRYGGNEEVKKRIGIWESDGGER